MYDIINMKNFRSKQGLLSQRLGHGEVAEETGSPQVEHPEESAWADFAKSLILAFQEDEKTKGSRGNIPAVAMSIPGVFFSLWSLRSSRCGKPFLPEGQRGPRMPGQRRGAG